MSPSSNPDDSHQGDSIGLDPNNRLFIDCNPTSIYPLKEWWKHERRALNEEKQKTYWDTMMTEVPDDLMDLVKLCNN